MDEHVADPAPLRIVMGMNRMSIYSAGDDTFLKMLDTRGSGALPPWSYVVKVVQSYPFLIADRQDASQSLTTGWVQWDGVNGGHPYCARYQLRQYQKDINQVFMVKLLQLQ